MKINLLPATAVIAFALCGCAQVPRLSGHSETVIDRAGIDVIASDSSRQLTYLKDRGTTERFCRGPGSDSVTTSGEGFNVGVPLHGIGAGIGEGKTAGAVDLGGRNPAVLVARELMYRACELASNTNADPATERQIYLQFLQAVVSISKAQTGAGVAAIASEPAAPAAIPAALVPAPASVD
jgi:hypothetical protein